MGKIIQIMREELEKTGADTLSDESVENCIRTIQKEKLRGRPRDPKLIWDIHPLTPRVREVHWSMFCSSERAHKTKLAYDALPKVDKANLHRILECTHLTEFQKTMIENTWSDAFSVLSYMKMIEEDNNETPNNQMPKELRREYDEMIKFLEINCKKYYKIDINALYTAWLNSR